MRVTIERSAFLKALTHVQSVVERRNTIPILSNVLIQAKAGEVRLTAKRAEADPKVFTQIHFHYRVKGRQLKTEAVARAIELSKEKYCSASIMIGKTAEITHDFEIIEDC